MHVRQAEVTALELERQFLVVDAQKVQHGRVQVVHVDLPTILSSLRSASSRMVSGLALDSSTWTFLPSSVRKNSRSTSGDSRAFRMRLDTTRMVTGRLARSRCSR